MYRAVIEHPDFMPVELKKRPDLLLGNDKGSVLLVVIHVFNALAYGAAFMGGSQ